MVILPVGYYLPCRFYHECAEEKACRDQALRIFAWSTALFCLSFCPVVMMKVFVIPRFPRVM